MGEPLLRGPAETPVQQIVYPVLSTGDIGGVDE
jgi:hypothetical protein